ncbi:MAG: hypothetical protein IPK50_03770 [Fibrobacterota bacterium]|nr:hypothetical protein [Fibrobacterota bacterium]QQS06013.1 MAG: hypothetical protein IPK50_03770 [Fibrobacterota bacterium]
MKTGNVLIAIGLVASACLAAETENCWSSNQFGGYLVCGTMENPRPATAEEIKRDQDYYAWKAKNHQLFQDNVAANLEATLVGLDPLVAQRIRTIWSSVQRKTDEKVQVYQDAQKPAYQVDQKPVPQK